MACADVPTANAKAKATSLNMAFLPLYLGFYRSRQGREALRGCRTSKYRITGEPWVRHCRYPSQQRAAVMSTLGSLADIAQTAHAGTKNLRTRKPLYG